MVLVIGKLPSVETGKVISQTGKLLSQPKKSTPHLWTENPNRKRFPKTEKLLSKIEKLPEIG